VCDWFHIFFVPALRPQTSQSDVLHLCGVPQLLDAALAGYNVTIFAYGQTGKLCDWLDYQRAPDWEPGWTVNKRDHLMLSKQLSPCSVAGSGKTYTMSGREELIGADGYQGDSSDGIMTRAVHYLYQQASLSLLAWKPSWRLVPIEISGSTSNVRVTSCFASFTDQGAQ
jgi:hypothetical protein